MEFSIDSTYCNYEQNIKEFWKNMSIYNKIMEKNKNGQEFRFMDGPPFVSSSSLHFGHLMIGYLKSTVLNYNQMKGYNCLNELGYDCHGLPIEMVVNKNLNLLTKKDIEIYGIEKYNTECKTMINNFSGAWTPIFENIGRWANFEKTYKTMDTNFMESVWWVFGELWKKKLIYKGFQVMPYSNSCNSPLSNFEAGQNYKDIETKTVYVLFKCINEENTYFVAWTTTPWTLPSNLALCVNPKGKYVYIIHDTKTYVIEENFIKNLELTNYNIVKTVNGNELVGMNYEPVFNYYSNFSSSNKFTIVADEFVDINTSTYGTGIVHLSPYYGEDDFRVCMNNKIVTNENINLVNTINENGYFTNLIKEFSNMLVTDKSTNDEIIKYLKQHDLIVKTQMYKHSYPYCYRTDTPLIYKANSGYFVSTTSIKDDLIKNNEKVSWTPSHIGSGRFKSWLENVKDWNISRDRFFGTPLPIWVSDDGEETVCISSIKELCELAGLSTPITDLHRETIDNIEIPSKMGKTPLKNIKLVLDCWFESGCVPIGQLHYPFENSNAFDNIEYLSDFIAEGLDQTRGWFYTLMVISTALFNKPAFKNVICTGLILDENGLKFSKKYGNFKNPYEILTKYGADIVRLYLLNSPTLNANPLFFNEESIKKLKQRIIPYINSVKLFITYIKVLNNTNTILDINIWKTTTNISDKWILSITSQLITDVDNLMKDYKLDKIIDLFLEYIENLTNWYIKLNRDRIKGLFNIHETVMSLSVLNHVIQIFNKVSAPFMPFLSEYIYGCLKNFNEEQLDSIHLTNYPTTNELLYDEESITKFNILKDIIKNIRTMRYNLPTSCTSLRVPLNNITIFSNDMEYIKIVQNFENVIKDEINCIEISYDNLNDNLTYKIIPNDKNLGKKFKKDLNKVKDLLKLLNNEYIYELYKNKIDFTVNNTNFQIEKTDYSIELSPNNNLCLDNILTNIFGNVMISINYQYTEKVHNMYQVNSLINTIQQLRKTNKLNPFNKIKVQILCCENIHNILLSFQSSMSQTLLCELLINSNNNNNNEFANTTFNFTYYDKKDEIVKISIYKLDNDNTNYSIDDCEF